MTTITGRTERAKYILLARFSPRPDASESESNQNQLLEMRSFVEKVGGEVVAEFCDDDISGNEADRPGLWSAVGALKQNYVLLVCHPDRIARSVYLGEVVRREVQKAGARIVSIRGNTEDNPEGNLLRQILAAFSEYERHVISIRTSAMMRAMQKAGRCMGGKPPFGWKAVVTHGKTKRGKPRRQLVPDPKQQEALAIIRELSAEGLGSLRIRRLLKDKGYRVGRGTIESVIKQTREGVGPPVAVSVPQWPAVSSAEVSAVPAVLPSV